MNTVVSQLALPLTLADHAVFQSFLPVGNETLVALLVELADRGDGAGAPGCWIWGAKATGKTHLLQAMCDRAGDRSVYVPLGDLVAEDSSLLDGLASRELVCIDDIDRVTGNDDWEHALFDLCNQIVEFDGRLIVAATGPPRAAAFSLADLGSRLSRLPTFRAHPLREADRAAALQLRARHRGLDLPDQTARFLLTHSRRDMASLYGLLDRLDDEALRAQRRLTIPFVKDVLDLN